MKISTTTVDLSSSSCTSSSFYFLCSEALLFEVQVFGTWYSLKFTSFCIKKRTPNLWYILLYPFTLNLCLHNKSRFLIAANNLISIFIHLKISFLTKCPFNLQAIRLHLNLSSCSLFSYFWTENLSWFHFISFLDFLAKTCCCLFLVAIWGVMVYIFNLSSHITPLHT